MEKNRIDPSILKKKIKKERERKERLTIFYHQKPCLLPSIYENQLEKTRREAKMTSHLRRIVFFSKKKETQKRGFCRGEKDDEAITIPSVTYSPSNLR